MAEYSEDFDTDALIEFLEDFPGRVHSVLRQGKINGRSFLTLTDEKLKKLGMKDDDRKMLLKKIDEVKEANKTKSEDMFCVIKEGPKVDSRAENPLEICFSPDLTKKEMAMTISFQTILPASLWGWDGKKCDLFISFEAPELGGWKGLLIPFEITGATSDGNVILQGQLHLEIKIIKQHNHRFVYKYVVFTSIIQKSFEHISHSLLLPGIKYVNRLLSIPENAVFQGGVFRCYDVLIYPDKKVLDLVTQRGQSILCNVHDYFVKTFPDVPVKIQSIQPGDSNLRFISLHAHLLQFQRILSNTSFTIHSSTVAQISRTIVSIYNQICERHVQVVYSWKKDTFKSRLDEAKQWMVDWFLKTSTMTLNNLQKEESSHTKHTYVISGAILLVAIHELKLMKLMSPEELLCVANLLHIQPSVREDGNKFCPSFDALMKCLVDDVKRKLKNAITQICHLIISETKGKNFDWLSLLPLYHFLTFDRKPFMELPTNHKNIKWNFGEELTANRSGFQEFVKQSRKYSSFEALWDNYEHLLSLDPMLMKVLMYMCPQNELVRILQSAPPILGISYLINIWSKKKSIKDDEVHGLVDLFKGIQISIVHLDGNSWDKVGDELFEATVSLTEAVTNKISYHKNNLEILKEIFEFHLFVISELNDHGKGKNLVSYLDRIDDLLYQWINHHNVIGRGIGGVNARKLKEEIELWKFLFERVECHETISSLWREKLKEIIERRAEQVPDEEKLSFFSNSHSYLEDGCPQVILDVLFQIGVNGLSFFKRKVALKTQEDVPATPLQFQESITLQLTVAQLHQELLEKQHLISDLKHAQTTLQYQITEHEDRGKLLQQQLQNQEEKEQQQLQDSQEKEKVLRQERNELRQKCNDVHQKLQKLTIDFQKNEGELYQELTDLQHVQTTLQHEIKEHENKESLLHQQLQAQEKREQQRLHDSQERERVLLQERDNIQQNFQKSTIALQETVRLLQQEKQKLMTESQDAQAKLQRQIRELELRGSLLQEQLQDQEEREQQQLQGERILRQERDDLHCQLQESTTAFQQIQQTNVNLQQQVQQLQQVQLTNATLQQHVQESQQAIATLQEQIEHLQEQSHWIVRREEIDTTEVVLGKGSYGEVKVAKFRGLKVAAKCLHELILSPLNIAIFTREMKIAARVRHPNLLQFIGATQVGTAIILTELMPTSLYKELEKSSLTHPQIIKIATDVSAALNYLHLWQPHPILHRDVSSPNVLLEPSGSGIWKAKLSDYGSANLVQCISAGSVAPGNPFYAAPEAPFPDQHTPAMDVYSFGVLLMVMILRQLPRSTTAERIAQAGTIQWPAMKPLVQRCVIRESQNRPFIAQVLTDLQKLSSI